LHGFPPPQPARDVVDIKTYDDVGRFIGNRGSCSLPRQIFWLALRNTLTFVLSPFVR
jgi:hypothetical protein